MMLKILYLIMYLVSKPDNIKFIRIADTA